ncbi:protein ANTAGONIST OF LIKE HETEROCHROMATIN PROTEIN 1-like, partial [Dendronephthya gigantea]|uniref:protein ANTAGONIST OF LIKE HETEROCHROMATIN PROTEIN 1-like n=1 Tax=Dendronephthya gigantea TaxID=151771 RepID=UPI001069279E
MAIISKKTLMIFLLKRNRKKNKYRKSMWVRKLFQERHSKGEFYLLVQDLRLFDDELFFRYFRMNAAKFEELLAMIAPEIQKSSVTRECIGPSERLCATLRYLTNGDSQTTTALCYRISPTTIGRIIFTTCEALWKILSASHLKCPNNQNEWKTIAYEFETKWNFPHCIGAIDGKHVVMQAPGNSGSMFFNYKKTHSIVLMAICNASYQFTIVDIGESGRNSDGGVFNHCQMGEAIKKNHLDIPDPAALPGSPKKYPYVLVADEAFQLQEHLMKPFPREVLGLLERIFNKTPVLALTPAHVPVLNIEL